MNTVKQPRLKVQQVLPWLALAIVFALSFRALTVYGRHNLNADMSSEMVLAELLNEEGRLLTDNWYYSTEVRVISAVPAFQLALAVFPNDWNAARTLAVMLLMALVAGSLVFMARGMGMRSGAVWAAAAILVPFSYVYRHLFLYGAYYMGFTIVAFLLLGNLLRLRKNRLCWPLLAVLSAYAGLAGVRMLMMLGVPLLLVCTLEAYGALRRSGTLREAVQTEEMTLFFGAALLTACMLGGYLVNSLVFTKLYHFRSFQDTEIGKLDLNLLGDQMTYWLTLFGFSEGKGLISFEGVVSMLGLGIALFLPFCVAALFVCRARQPIHDRLMPELAAAAVLLGMLLNALTSQGVQSGMYSPSYYMVGIQLTIIAAFLLLERMQCRMEGARTLAMIALCGVFLLEGVVCLRDMRASKADYENVADFLREQGYSQGYANFWEGNVLPEASNGEFEVWIIENFGNGHISQWLQRADHQTREPEGKVFAVLGSFVTRPYAFEEHLLGDFNGIKVYGFESAEQFRGIIHEAAQTDAIWREQEN